MINYLKNQGLDERTISIIVIMLASFMFLFGVVVMFIVIWDTVHGVSLPPWVTLFLGSLGTFGVTILTSVHTTGAINGTAAKTAASTVSAFTASQTAAVNANTAATEANTASMNKEQNAS